MSKIERPLDLLNSLKGKNIGIVFNSRHTQREEVDDEFDVEGILEAFDIHLNVVVETTNGQRFVKGDNILFIDPID